MKTKLWVMIVVMVCVIGYSAGYIISSSTGVEPGFFEIAETGAYGVVTDNQQAEGISQDMQDYYNTLSADE